MFRKFAAKVILLIDDLDIHAVNTRTGEVYSSRAAKENHRQELVNATKEAVRQ